MSSNKGKQRIKMGDLPRTEEALSSEQAKAVKGGTYMGIDGINNMTGDATPQMNDDGGGLTVGGGTPVKQQPTPIQANLAPGAVNIKPTP